jgi:hypothetical protein
MDQQNATCVDLEHTKMRRNKPPVLNAHQVHTLLRVAQTNAPYAHQESIKALGDREAAVPVLLELYRRIPGQKVAHSANQVITRMKKNNRNVLKLPLAQLCVVKVRRVSVCVEWEHTKVRKDKQVVLNVQKERMAIII